MPAAIKSKLNYNDAAGGPGCKSFRGLGFRLQWATRHPVSLLIFLCSAQIFLLGQNPQSRPENFSTGDLSELGVELSKVPAAIKSKLNYNDAAGGPGCKSFRGLGVSAPVGHKAPCLFF